MVEPPGRERRFNEEEVALIIKRAAELQQTEQTENDPGNALSLTEVEQIAREAGIDPRLIRRAASGLEHPEHTNRPSPWFGVPTHLVFERVVDGEVSSEDFEALINEVRRSIGDNGMPSVLGKSLAWSSSMRGRRRAQGRQIDVSVVPRGGVTTIRVEEELRNLGGALVGGIVGGGGGGTSGAVIGGSIAAFHSAPIAVGLLACSLGSFFMLARTIFRSIAVKREKQLDELIGRLEDIAQSSISDRAVVEKPKVLRDPAPRSEPV